MGDSIDVHALMRRQVRTAKDGSVKLGGFRVDFEIEDLIVHADARELCAQLASGIRDTVQQQMKSTGVQAAPATVARRERARRGRSNKYARSKTRDWYLWRYAGGKIGETPPLIGRTELFMDSGRFADNLVLTPRKNSSGESVITMNVPANRLSKDSFARSYQFADMVRQLKLYVPMIGGGTLSGKSATAMREIMSEIGSTAIQVGSDRTSALLSRRRAAVFRALKSLGGFA